MYSKLLRSMTMSFALVMLFAGVALAKDIVVMNGTSFSLHGLSISPSESKNWGPNLLQGDTLKPGEGLKIKISGDANNWDLAVTDDDNAQVSFDNLDFRKASQVTLHSDGTATLE